MAKTIVEVKPIEVLLATVPQAAQLLSVSERHVWHLVKAEELEVIHIGGATRIAVDELRRFARKGSPLRRSKAEDAA